MTRYIARLAALAAVGLLVLALAGCGGDSSKAEPVTVTEQVTVTDATTDAAPTTESEPATDASTDETTGGSPLSDQEVDQLAGIYKQFLGLNDDQAKCLAREAQKMSGVDTSDLSSLIDAGALEMFSRCGINLADLASKFGNR
ncbi:MAG TPA: hypothetical protein PKE32_04450 [Miltoncostaeaceae bacterium]|nr:hypothetical protein [Miltoncostaeaceae bacterium]